MPPNECRFGAAQVSAVSPTPPSRVTNDPGSDNTLINANGHLLGKNGRVAAKKLRSKKAVRDDLPNSSASGGLPADKWLPAAVGATVPDARRARNRGGHRPPRLRGSERLPGEAR
jgi:hypothetical protein